MNPFSLVLTAILFSLLVERSSGALLNWSEKEEKRTVASGTEFVFLTYKFTNSSESAVELKKIETSCGCTVAEIVPSIIASGASGVVTAKVQLNGFSPVSTVKIRVTVKERFDKQDGGKIEKEELVDLSTNIVIREYVSLDRSVLIWRVGAASETKKILISAADKKAFKISKIVLPSIGEFDLKCSDLEDFEYRLDIRPLTTASSGYHSLSLEIRMDDGQVVTKFIHLVIK